MTNVEGLSRRGVLQTGAMAVAAAWLAPPGRATGQTVAPAEAGAAEELALAARPTRVFKVRDRSHENTESWIVSLVAESRMPVHLMPVSMTVELLRGGAALRASSHTAAGFAPLTYETKLPPRTADGGVPDPPVYWPFVVRLRHTEPVTLGVDGMRIVVEAGDDLNRRWRGAVHLPVETYIQKTVLRFPFRGKGIVLQAGAANGGHRNRSGQFAIDACGLDDAWSIVAPGPGKRNADYRGWGRPVLSPADGVVVRLRHDRPDQPVADASDPKYYAAEYPQGGDPGNYLVIDHGNGEFSMLAHFRAGSMRVRLGERVRVGQPLGALGHSGDTDGPHVHFQLQAGPDWENADALPCHFANIDQQVLDRGTYFEAK